MIKSPFKLFIKRNFTSNQHYDVVQYDYRFNSYDLLHTGITLEQAQALVDIEDKE